MSSFVAKIRFKLLCSDAAQFGHSFAIPLTSGPLFSASAPDFCTIQKWPKLGGAERLKGPDQGGRSVHIFVSYSILPTALDFIASSGFQAHCPLPSRDAICKICKTSLDDSTA